MKLVYDGAFQAYDDDGPYWYHLTIETDRALEDATFERLSEIRVAGNQEEVADYLQAYLPGLSFTVSVKYPDGSIFRTHRP